MFNRIKNIKNIFNCVIFCNFVYIYIYISITVKNEYTYMKTNILRNYIHYIIMI